MRKYKFQSEIILFKFSLYENFTLILKDCKVLCENQKTYNYITETFIDKYSDYFPIYFDNINTFKETNTLIITI